MFWIEVLALEMGWFAINVTAMISPVLAYAGLLLLVFILSELSITGVESETVMMRVILGPRFPARSSRAV